MFKPAKPLKISEEDFVTFYGALFALSAIDGSMDLEEIDLILELISLDKFSEEARLKIQNYIANPPSFDESMKLLRQQSEIVKFGFMINLLEVAWADDILENRELEAISCAQEHLALTDIEIGAIDFYVNQLKQALVHQFNNESAEEAVQVAIEQLVSVKIPLEVIHFSGLAMKLNALGINTSFENMGVKINVLSGVNANTLLGTSTYYNLSNIFTSQKRKETKKFQARKQKSQSIVENIKQTITEITEHIYTLEADEENLEKHQETIEQLGERLKTLQQLQAIHSRGRLKRHLQQNQS